MMKHVLFINCSNWRHLLREVALNVSFVLDCHLTRNSLSDYVRWSLSQALWRLLLWLRGEFLKFSTFDMLAIRLSTRISSIGLWRNHPHNIKNYNLNLYFSAHATLFINRIKKLTFHGRSWVVEFCCFYLISLIKFIVIPVTKEPDFFRSFMD